MDTEIVVQDPPKSPERQHAMPETINTERKNYLAINVPYPEDNLLADAKEQLITVLKKLQKLHNQMRRKSR